MKRRSFLRAVLVTAGGVWVGCDDDTSSGGRDTGGDGGDAGGDGGDGGGDTGDNFEDGSAFFPQSVVSGDPRDTSVILWTRVQDDERDDDVELLLQVALDDQFTQLVELDGGASMAVMATADHDHCVKVRVTGLEGGTEYFYRFVHTRQATGYVSRTGRTKTAPAPDADAAVRFAVVSCQDYNGRYYNSYRRMASEDLDFFVHLGDYVYETTGDPAFQDTAPDRVVAFTDAAGAIVFNEGTEDEFFAARTLSNYRELYKIYRSDADLQAIHERLPMLAVWDDHEFSDDSHGATGTYYDGAQDETDLDRRKAANQAWFEYMPVDYLDDPDFEYDAGVDFPNDLKIFRDFVFGQHLHLVLTDLRSRRSDHIIREDAIPGAMATTEAELEEHWGEVPDFAMTYVDIATFAGGIYQTALQGAAEAQGYDPDLITGNFETFFINNQVTAINEDLPEDEQIPLITSEQEATLPRGISYGILGRFGTYSSLGSRYLANEPVFAAYAAVRYGVTDGASETAMGEEQESWFLETMQGSDRTWKVWGNEYCLLPHVVDLTNADLPENFKARFHLVVEDWNGMPNRRDALLIALADVENAVALTGDIHAFFAGTPSVSDDPAIKIPEFVTSGISSTSFRGEIVRLASSDPNLVAAGAPALAQLVDNFLAAPGANPTVGHFDSASNGYMTVDVTADEMIVTFMATPANNALENLPSVDEEFTPTRFRVVNGSREIYKDFDGEWRVWDSTEQDWVAQEG